MWLPLALASTVCWAWINVLNSAVVARYHKNPLFILTTQASISCVLLLSLAMVVPVATTWVVPILLSAFIAYVGDFLFFWIVDRLDISVVNAAWAILALFLSLGGFVLFGERWTVLQGIGAALVIGGVLLISFTHAHVSLPRTLGLLTLLALLYVPFQLTRKAAVMDGQSTTAVFFWMLFGREMLSLVAPFVTARSRAMMGSAIRSMPRSYYAVNFVIILLYYGAELANILSYRIGPISLISVVVNIQPFFVILFAWLLWRFLPRIAPRELLEKQSLSAKFSGFAIAFAGLALLGIPQ